MTDALLWHRIQFVFTITYHYLFPQLTMGLALLIVVFKSLALRLRDESYNEVARFWARIFALNFAMGVVTGIPMEFQFGTNWSRFSRFSGEVVGQALAMEGVFAFFLESTFLGLFLFGERRLGPRRHLAAAVALALGSWLSGYFIIVANAFMQHPVGYRLGEDGVLHLESFSALHLQPLGAVAVRPQHGGLGRHGVVRRGRRGGLLVADGPARPARRRSACGRVSSRDWSPACWSRSRPVTARARWWRSTSRSRSPRWRGSSKADRMPSSPSSASPNVAARRLENPIVVPWILSFLCYGSFGSTVHGLNDFPQDQWPHNVELLYYSYHIMVGLGTLFILTMGTRGVAPAARDG